MKSVIGMCLMGSVLLCGAHAQDPSKPVLRPGVSVQMAVAEHAVEMRAADELDATVVAITQEGKVYVGIKPTETAALSDLAAATPGGAAVAIQLEVEGAGVTRLTRTNDRGVARAVLATNRGATGGVRMVITTPQDGRRHLGINLRVLDMRAGATGFDTPRTGE
jgi:hypothetical protein